jgi:hypothetical protein
MFCSDCPLEEQEKVQEILQVSNIAQEEKYLGLPTPDGRMGKEKFKTASERLSKKFSG